MDMKEKNEPVVALNGVSGNSLKLLIEYMYTSNIVINNENVVEVLAAADYLQMVEVQKFCFDFLLTVIDKNTCFTIYTLARLYEDEDLLRASLQFINDNFEDVKAFAGALSKADLINCIVSLDRNKIPEKLVFETILTGQRSIWKIENLSFLTC